MGEDEPIFKRNLAVCYTRQVSATETLEKTGIDGCPAQTVIIEMS